MNIDFSTIPETLVENPRGGQGTFGIRDFKTPDNRVFLGRLLPGSGFGMHAHTSNSETMFFLSGVGRVVTEEGEEKVFPGAVHHSPRGASHCLINEGAEDLVFYGVIPEHGVK